MEYHQYAINDVCLSDEILIATLTTIRTYLIRRRILGLTQGENKNIVTLSKKIEGLAKGSISMLELLTNLYYRLRLPNDNEMKNTLTSMNFYELKQYSKFILGKIEEHNTKVAVDFRNPKITIEHIMPQILEDSWKVELGEKFDEIQKNYLHNIGNLILTEFNSEIGNKSFEEKKRKLRTSSLNYRLDIIERNTWSEQSIKEHQENMISWFLCTFPLPEQYQEKANWNTQTIENTSFSPLDTDAGEMAEGNKPSELHILEHVIKVNSWQDVFIKFLKYLKEKPDFDFEFILDNQSELFKRGEETILKWSVLKDLIDTNVDLSNRYKTFEGKVWEKVKELDDDLLFIHINISASSCMTRIANVMDKFNMPEHSVAIKLK
ncbi:MAG: HNH endonuclease family protein [Pseudanabaenaceae cyanobacterium bins.39]|nr:HNH endonuclease family protein [Pseudanabaenaceae cyanobacterium bins.39]